MQTIWKYKLNVGPTYLEMPKNAEILSVQLQKGELCLWAKVDDDNQYDREERRFEVLGTGHQIPSKLKYITTYLDLNDSFVGHVFEII